MLALAAGREVRADAPRTKAEADARARDLAELRARIAKMKSALDKKEASQREARDLLRDSEHAISEVNRTLATLETEARALRKSASTIDARRRALAAEIGQQQAAIARLLAARHAAGAPDALRLALSGTDPGEVARKLYYLAQLSRARAEVIASYRADVAELEALRREAEAKAERLGQVRHQERDERERLLAEQRARRKVLDQVADEIRRNRRQMRVLRADEARLAKLVEEIGRLLAARPGASVVTIQKSPGAGTGGGSLAAQRGQLRLPVRGELVGRYGAPREASGAAAKGLFIRAKEGTPVTAIAHGQVVFADWMRGFGNLLIIDHGDDYLSIYAYNEALLKQVGDPVAMGERIAIVGSSGGREQSGLYFEMRHLGKTFDPMAWVQRN
ncbi:MAG: peptidoglycan DD-metalloendopeptidase family protein [Betaproteobacteria bacterium]|nr:peptidoglycan DD-metalloendopeptidase family protein [Betaproteobacteria bacterium]